PATTTDARTPTSPVATTAGKTIETIVIPGKTSSIRPMRRESGSRPAMTKPAIRVRKRTAAIETTRNHCSPVSIVVSRHQRHSEPGPDPDEHVPGTAEELVRPDRGNGSHDPWQHILPSHLQLRQDADQRGGGGEIQAVDAPGKPSAGQRADPGPRHPRHHHADIEAEEIPDVAALLPHLVDRHRPTLVAEVVDP